MPRRNSFAVLSLAAIAIAATAGCGEPTPVTEGIIHIDNGLTSTMVWHLDGKEVGPVEAGQVEMYRIGLGERTFRVTVEGRTIYEKKHTLTFGDRPYKHPTFVLNPDDSHRYCQVKVVYGNDSLSDGTADMLVSAISWAANQGHEGISEEQRQKELEYDRLKYEYEKLLSYADPKPYDTFFEVSPYCRVLQPVPNTMYTGKYSSSTSLVTLMRVPREIHDFLSTAKLKTEFTKEDIREMARVQGLIQDMVPTQ